MAKSFWSSYKIYCSFLVARLKQFLNVTPASENASPIIRPGMTKVGQRTRKSSKQEPQTPAQMDKLSDPNSGGPNIKGSSDTNPSENSRILSALPSFSESGSDIGSAIMEFKRALTESWTSPVIPGERGIFLIDGRVELKGTKGCCVLDIVAAYHPRERKYTTVRAGVKYIQPKRQYPRRERPSSQSSETGP